jgi:predicted Zn-dependent protease with MMP-like domain
MYILLISFFAIIIVGTIAVPMLGGFGKKSKHRLQSSNKVTLDKKFVQDKWQEIEELVSLGGASQLKTAIMEADKLVDYVLKSHGVAGETMGERMKNAKSKFSDYNDYDNLWFSHKVRNSIVHETNHELGVGESRRTIEYFGKALKELRAL